MVGNIELQMTIDSLSSKAEADFESALRKTKFNMADVRSGVGIKGQGSQS